MAVKNAGAVRLALLILFAGGPGTVAAQIHFRSYGDLGGRAAANGSVGRGSSASTGDVFSPDGRYLVRKPDERTLVFWDLASEHEAITFDHAGAAAFCRFSPDSRTLAVAVDSRDAEECEVVVWDVATHARLHSIARGFRCFDLQFSRDNRALVVSTLYLRPQDPLNRTTVWDVETGRELQELQTEDPNKRITNPIVSLDQFSPDGRWLAACGFSGVSIWDTRYWGRARLFEGAGGVSTGGFSPDGRLFASTHVTRPTPMTITGKGLAVWNINKGEIVADLPIEHAKNENVGGWPVFAPDGQSLAATVSIFRMKVGLVRALTMRWDFSAGKQTIFQRSPPDPRYCSLSPPAFSPDGKSLAYVLWQPRPAIQLLETRTWQPLRKLEMELASDTAAGPESLPAQAFGVWFSPDGQWLAASRSVPELRECEAFLWRLHEVEMLDQSQGR